MNTQQNIQFYYRDGLTFVRISPPGELGNVADRPARQLDFDAHPRQFKQFQKNEEQTPEGEPIDTLFPKQQAVADHLKGFKVYTIEQLANLSGHALNCIGLGAQQWVNQAIRWLAECDKGISAREHKKDIDRLEQRLEALEHIIQKVGEQKKTKPANFNSLTPASNTKN